MPGAGSVSFQSLAGPNVVPSGRVRVCGNGEPSAKRNFMVVVGEPFVNPAAIVTGSSIECSGISFPFLEAVNPLPVRGNGSLPAKSDSSGDPVSYP
jgi:hypothetical protein